MSETGKQAAGQAAAALVQDGMMVGLGSGSTMQFAISALGRRLREGLRFVAVATSRDIAALAGRLGIELAEPGERKLDLALDGADEVERGTLRLIKGAGGALLREKVVAQSSRRFVVLADASKLVDRLGTRALLPVELDRFGHAATMQRIAELGGRPVLRRDADGAVFVTDGGHVIVDCAGFAPIGDPFTLQRSLRAVAGVVETGLFLLPVEQVLVGDANGGVQVLREG
jgi:ribose 5-phosphate isomerase A